ncbi:MAG: hypothetical protein Kow0029_13940 [Candidatus Rifleibacteriota bacterium]
MKKIRAGLFVVGAMALGGSILVSSTFADQTSTSVLEVIRHPAVNSGRAETFSRAVRPATSKAASEKKLTLVPPPAELPSAPSHRMVSSVKAFAPSAPVQNNQKNTVVVVKETPRQVVAQAGAQKTKPEKLFSYVRLLNYAPHPLTEEFLQKSPLELNGQKYWFTVKYDEDWKVVGDEEGYINGISFEIGIMQGKNKVRTLKTPKVALNPKTLKKGMVLGIAEVAPYKFTIAVEEFTKTKKGISELVFKLDLAG